MENEELLQEEDSLITLTDENGNEVTFEYMDCIEYDGKEYLVLLPTEEEDTQIVILEVEPVDEENENYLAVEDEAILDAVYAIFKDRLSTTFPLNDLSNITITTLVYSHHSHHRHSRHHRLRSTLVRILLTVHSLKCFLFLRQLL